MITHGRERTMSGVPRLAGGASMAPSTPREVAAVRAGRRRWTMPARYGMIAMGSGLLMVASAASVPLGPAASSAGRELLTLVSGACGIALLARASFSAPLAQTWSRWSVRLRSLLLIVALILVAGTLVTFAGGAFTILRSSPAQTYATDIVSFAHENADLVLAGHNPYDSDWAFRDALTRFPLALGTPLRGDVFGTGFDHPIPARIAAVQTRYIHSPASVPGAFDPRTLHSYPALSFLVYVPLLWAGIQNVLVLHLLIYWGLFAWLVWLTPAGWRHWGALVALAAMPTMAASLIVTDEVIAIALVVTAWHFRERRWLFALLLGAGCAYKQYSWFFIPFFAVEILLAYGWREVLRRGALVLGVFLAPNLPYLIASPKEWFQSMFLPMSEPLFATGMGIITLPIGHIVPYGTPLLYALLEIMTLAGLLWVYARWRQRIGNGLLLLALVPLYFAFRSAPSYFAFLPWLALYAANERYAFFVHPTPSPVVTAGEALLKPVARQAQSLRGELKSRWSRPAQTTPGAPLTLEHRTLSHADRPRTASSVTPDDTTADQAPRRLPSYIPTGWPLANRMLDTLDRVTNGRADWFQRALSFLFIGGIGAVVNLAVFSLLYDQSGLFQSERSRWLVAFVAATELSILVNFLLNDHFTFRRLPGHERRWAARCARFHVTATGGVLLTLAISASLHLFGVSAVLAQALAILVVTCFNFAVHHLYTYRPVH